MGPGQDRTRDPWICSQTRICCQTRYRLRYAARYPDPLSPSVSVQWFMICECVISLSYLLLFLSSVLQYSFFEIYEKERKVPLYHKDVHKMIDDHLGINMVIFNVHTYIKHKDLVIMLLISQIKSTFTLTVSLAVDC